MEATILEKHIQEVCEEIIEKGCTIPMDILKSYFGTTVSLAVVDKGIKESNSYLDAIGKTITDYLKPEDLVRDEWYYCKDRNFEWILKFDKIEKFNELTKIWSYKAVCPADGYKDNSYGFILVNINDKICKATKEEVLKYFPDENFAIFDSTLKTFGGK